LCHIFLSALSFRWTFCTDYAALLPPPLRCSFEGESGPTKDVYPFSLSVPKLLADCRLYLGPHPQPSHHRPTRGRQRSTSQGQSVEIDGSSPSSHVSLFPLPLIFFPFILRWVFPRKSIIIRRIPLFFDIVPKISARQTLSVDGIVFSPPLVRDWAS